MIQRRGHTGIPLHYICHSILLIHIRSSRIRVISDVIFPGQQGPQIIAADIGEPELARSQASSIYLSRTKSHISLNHNSATNATEISPDTPSLTNAEVKATLRRLSKMVLAGYGGASLLFFGVSPSAFGPRSSASTSLPTSHSAAIAREKTVEEANLTNAIDASEAEAAGDADSETESAVQQEYSWWDVLLGKHDQEIFELSTAHVDDSLKDRASTKERNKNKMKATAVRLVSCVTTTMLSRYSLLSFFKGYWKGTSHAPFLGSD